MVTRSVAVVALAVMMLAGCGSDQLPRAGVTRADEAVFGSALAGEPRRAATDPRAVAGQITAAEAAVRNRNTPPELVAAAGRSAQAGYLVLIERPDWDAAVLAEVPPPLQDTVRRITAAGRELRAMLPRVPTTVPAWRIVEPPAVPQLRAYYDEGQRRFGVPWSVLAAVHLVETRMSRIVGLSSAGAQGPMQFLASTWASYGLGGDVWDTRDAILGAANYLASGGAAAGTDAGLDTALYRYNNDPRYVRAVRHYAALMQADERALLGFHAWQVYYRTHLGEVLLPTGYVSTHSMPAEEYLARRPR